MIIDLKSKIDELLKQGKKVKEVNFVRVTEPGLIMPDYIAGSEYDSWMNNIKIFAVKHCKEHPLYNDIIKTYERRNNSWGTSSYEQMMGYLRSLLIDEDFINRDNKVEPNKQIEIKQRKMLFISHSSQDIEYVKTLVSLFEYIGFRSNSLLFCSSLSGYNIPNGEHIFNYLRNQYSSKDLHVIFLLSDNYYSSPACLNEMGATWVKSMNHTAILTPEFNYSQIRGAVDASKIWFKMDDKDRINEFKDSLIGNFELNDINNNIWERKRDEYIEKVRKLYDANQYKMNPQKVDLEDILPHDSKSISCVFRFINKSDKTSKCKNISVKVIDSSNNEICFEIGYEELNDIFIYSKENKRITLVVDKSRIKGFENFNLFEWQSFKTKSNWTSII